MGPQPPSIEQSTFNVNSYSFCKQSAASLFETKLHSIMVDNNSSGAFFCPLLVSRETSEWEDSQMRLTIAGVCAAAVFTIWEAVVRNVAPCAARCPRVECGVQGRAPRYAAPTHRGLQKVHYQRNGWFEQNTPAGKLQTDISPAGTYYNKLSTVCYNKMCQERGSIALRINMSPTLIRLQK